MISENWKDLLKIQPPRRVISAPIVISVTPFTHLSQHPVDFGTFKKDYYVTDFGTCASVIVPSEQCVLMTAQYRYLIDGISLELPGGMTDENENIKDAAIRECREETGMACSDLIHLLTYRPGLDNVENLTHIYVARCAERDSTFEPTPDEVLGIAWIPLKDCLKMVFKKEITDAATVMGLLAYDHFLRCPPNA
jgi:ADP-ribose pyrophosphatase